MTLKSHSYGYIGQAMICTPFYAAGFHFKDFLKQSQFNKRTFIIGAVVWITSMLLFYKSPQNLSIMLITQPYIAFYISAFAGSFVVIELCKLFKSKWISYFGQNSIVPMLVQMVIIWLIAKLWLADSMFSYLIISVAAIILSGLCIPLFRNRYYRILQ